MQVTQGDSSPVSRFPFPLALSRYALVFLLALLFAGAPVALAQNCAMCYDSAAQQGPEAARALNTAIVVLLLPSVLLFGGVLVTALRHQPEHKE